MLAREQKKSVIDRYQTHATDTGSPEVQIAIISERIGQLTDHFKAHQKGAPFLAFFARSGIR